MIGIGCSPRIELETTNLGLDVSHFEKRYESDFTVKSRRRTQGARGKALANIDNATLDGTCSRTIFSQFNYLIGDFTVRFRRPFSSVFEPVFVFVVRIWPKTAFLRAVEDLWGVWAIPRQIVWLLTVLDEE